MATLKINRDRKWFSGWKSLATALVALAFMMLMTGCAATRSIHSKSAVTSDISSRTGLAVSENRQAGEGSLPGAITSGAPLSLDQAIETSLANNDGFHATLAQMGMAEGDYIQSSLLTNPNFVTMIPVGVKQWEWTLFVPVEAFLLRPERMAMADRECERVANQLVRNGMQLVRDVQVAYANLALATEQYLLAQEALSIRNDIAGLTEKRLADGDIAELEAIQARIDVLNSKANAALLEQNVVIAREQLALLMGIPEQADFLQVSSMPDCKGTQESIDALVAQGLDSRPDLRAADWAVAAAETRCRLAHKAWWRFDAGMDANGSGERGYEAGPVFRFDVPVFNRNQGGIARACAELEAAKYNRDQIRDQIVQQIRLASTQSRQASDNFHALDAEVLPALDEALSIAKKGFEGGGTSYLLVLQTTSQYLDAKARMLDQAAAVCRAQADLELGCGRRLNFPTQPLIPRNAFTPKSPSP